MYVYAFADNKHCYCYCYKLFHIIIVKVLLNMSISIHHHILFDEAYPSQRGLTVPPPPCLSHPPDGHYCNVILADLIFSQTVPYLYIDQLKNGPDFVLYIDQQTLEIETSMNIF